MYLMTFPPDGFAQTTKDSLNSHDAQSLQEFLKQSDASPVSRVGWWWSRRLKSYGIARVSWP